MTWTCPDCEGVSTADLIRAGAYTPPTDPDATCSGCGASLSATVRSALLLAQIRDRLAALGGDPSAGILSGRAAARRLGIGRDTLARLAEAGVIASVPKGARHGFRAADVEALIEKGYTLPDAPTRPAPPTKRKRRRAPESADAAEIAAKLAEF